ncbi:SHOCT domain-containing protein [Microtetraspora sp. NBRC 16547]|uniref:SHOCT domain-containing protein n=1 Tax=Microtetraspora sp. NBRC 16547 TaxID=3030993 RepID=UPI002554E67E|nr:SHOCT domain-containing protein [Microtetraspora sp. NBRC 16547]
MAEGAHRPDIQAAADRMAGKFGSRREIRHLVDYLLEDEVVDQMAGGAFGPGIGLVVLTDRRLLFVKDGLVAKVSEDFPVGKISSVHWEPGSSHGTLTVTSSGDKAEIEHIHNDDGERIADAIRHRLPGARSAASPAPAEAPVSGEDDVFEALRKLGELRDKGVVTDAEFEAKKAELLARI